MLECRTIREGKMPYVHRRGSDGSTARQRVVEAHNLGAGSFLARPGRPCIQASRLRRQVFVVGTCLAMN
jgi:hypothetical protein